MAITKPDIQKALESLFVDDALLDRMQRSILICQPFDRQDLLVAHRMCEDRARIMRYIVKQHRTGAAFGAVAPQLRSREPQLVSQRPSQRLLLMTSTLRSCLLTLRLSEPLAGAADPVDGRAPEQIVR